MAALSICFALLRLCVAALPPEELEVLQQLLPLAAEACNTEGVECENGHVTKLDLKGRKMKEIPENVDLLQYLEFLMLADNQLKRLPESFGKLKSLRALYLGNNHLKLLPESFGDLKSLERMLLENNQLQSLPESFGSLKSLGELDLHSNKLQSLPESFGGLKSLMYLDLKNNQLKLLPESFGHLKSCKEVQLNNNQLKLLPESFGDLESLQRLLLEDNQLQNLPESFGGLKSLWYLDLKNNQLKVLPETLGDLESLKEMQLNNNELNLLPETLGDLKSLQELRLNNNQLKLLPESFGSLQSLRELRLKNNQLKLLPESFGDLESLQCLEMEKNAVASLPDSLGKLQNLQILMLSDNQLKLLPESVGDLQGLEELYLNNNELQSLPESFGGLKSLLIIYLNNNQLKLLPQSFGDLKSLERLLLAKNQLQGLAETFGGLKSLGHLDLSKNQLESLPASFGNLKTLVHLSLQQNKLADIRSAQVLHLKSLKVLLLQQNALRCKLDAFCQLHQLATLYLHRNLINGSLPACLASLKSLRVLTLHQNQLRGTIPETFGHLDDLRVLTLHANQMTGSIPRTFSKLKSLAFFSAYENSLSGPIPELNLRQGCEDDMSFSIMALLWYTENKRSLTCSTASNLDLWKLTPLERERVENACPATLGLCATASARGPTLLLHGNRLSCAVPQQVTEAPLALRSLVLIGNALGNEFTLLPSWVAETERQPFLYISGATLQNLGFGFIGLAVLSTVAWCGIIGRRHVMIKEAPSDPTEISHLFVIKASWLFAPLAIVLLCLYVSGSSYYNCGDPFLASSMAYFQGDGWEQQFLCLGWILWIFGSALQLGMVPKPPRRSKGPKRSRSGKLFWWTGWLFLVLCLSAPSMAYATASTLPRQNVIITGRWMLPAIKHQAALVMLLVDMLVTPKLAATVARRSGIKRSMLLMAARSCTMWLNATMFTLYLNEHCQRGWTRLWTVCDPRTEDYKSFNITLGDHQLLEPLNDLCKQNKEWATDACMRSLMGTLAPLFLSKMIQRALLQPVITLVLWRLSVAEDDKLFFTPLAFLGMRRWRICTSRSLDRAQQATFLVTLTEVVLIWGPFIPLLVPAAALAAMTNLRVFRVGTRVFGATVPELEEGETGSMSKKYMRASLVVLLIFQNWFAWTAPMSGRSLLVLPTIVFLTFLTVPRKSRRESTEAKQWVELTTMG